MMILKEMIEEKSKDKQVFFVYEETHMKEKRLESITEKSDNAIIIASYTFSTAANICEFT